MLWPMRYAVTSGIHKPASYKVPCPLLAFGASSLPRLVSTVSATAVVCRNGILVSSYHKLVGLGPIFPGC